MQISYSAVTFRAFLSPAMKKIKLKHTHQATNTDQQEEEHDNQFDIFQLPNYIILEILSRIPIKSLIQCRSVCKSWRHSLSDSHFTKSLFSQTPTCILLQNSSTINPKSPRLFLIDLDKASGRNDVVIRLPKDPNVPTRGVQVVGSCNGLLCVYDRLNCGQLYISNPIIGESLTLPAPSMEIDYQFVCGFGFCPSNEVYKVVVVTSPSEGTDHGELKVLTVGSGVWRSIGNCVYHFGYQPYGVYLNGVLHWIVQTSEGSVSICAFDVENESFRELPPPPCCLKKCVISIGVLEGWLSVFVRSGSNINVWMMKDYGVEESWTKELVVKEKSSGMIGKLFGHWTRSSSAAQVLKFTKKGQVLLLDKYKLHVYTPGKRGFVPLEIDGVPYMVEAFAHIPSFISLANALRG
ncbi:putative F-box domain-containing protein [Rosa chinensis]|uniref:Putative F-box domain-containing protein n=1 Tax=Rosa chinensis TaxID=74649 RepID=A0A2P6QVU9_ROSCH|nr:F-box protein At3g07870 [Rosa chinensis]PRQ38328.1 putative F-box domain-containing protein [Rosa chinensis]